MRKLIVLDDTNHTGAGSAGLLLHVQSANDLGLVQRIGSREGDVALVGRWVDDDHFEIVNPQLEADAKAVTAATDAAVESGQFDLKAERARVGELEDEELVVLAAERGVEFPPRATRKTKVELVAKAGAPKAK